MKLHAKTAIVTGAGAGIGAASAKLFAREGANVVLVDLESAALETVSQEIARAGGGVILNTASATALRAAVDRACYTATKAAVVGLTKSMALDYVHDKIRVNCLCPGTIDTPSLGRRISALPNPVGARKRFIARQPMGRFGTAEEIAEAALYLASEDSDLAFAIDGGLQHLMPHCTAHAVQWKNRSAFRISNRRVELTILLGGGHIADFRLCHLPVNVLWEAPWPTIEPQTFSSHSHAETYGDGPVGKLLAGYTGHAIAIPYFGMPTEQEEQQGLALHGEAATSEWRVVDIVEQDKFASLQVEVDLPVSQLQLRRKLTLLRDSTCVQIDESVFNQNMEPQNLQWVQHAAFGEPFLTSDCSTIHCSAQRGAVWPGGYEGCELLADNTEFT